MLAAVCYKYTVRFTHTDTDIVALAPRQTNVEGVVGPVTAITGSESHDRHNELFRRRAGGSQSADWGRDTSAINARASDQPS